MLAHVHTSRLAYLLVGIALVASLRQPLVQASFVGTGRAPLVLVGGQIQQLTSPDYLYSVGGMSVNATPATSADFEATTFNGVPLTGAGGGSVSVTNTTSVVSAGWKTVVLSTEGTIDWLSATGQTNVTSCTFSSSAGTPSKASGGRQLACAHGGVSAWLAGNNASASTGSCGAGCTYALTWANSDSTQTASPASPTGSAYYQGYGVNGTPTPSPYGWTFAAPARISQLVLRLYLAVANMTSVTCTGRVSDGSASATTASFNTGTGVLMFYAPVFTYHAAIPGSYFMVKCTGTPNAPTGGDSFSYWYAETLSTI